MQIECIWKFLSFALLKHFFNLRHLLLDEQDSMMYQSVGHEGVSLYAEAMGVPLYTGTTKGKTNQTSMVYQEEPGDEVEDLMELLQKVKVCEWNRIVRMRG